MVQQSRSIGVFCPDLGGYYFGGMLSGIHHVARSAGVPLIVIQQAIADQPKPPFSADHCAGWIVIHPIERDRTALAALCASAAPVVMVPVPVEGVPCTLVQVDNRGGMCAAVMHLIDHGHQRIAYVDHGSDTWSQQRYLGYCDALAKRGIAHDPELVIHLDAPKTDNAAVHRERGEHAAQYLLEHELSCTALAAATDTCAIAIMHIIQAAGRSVPDDLAVVGFDDIAEAQYASPPLTTVRSSFDAIGRTAAEQVLAAIGGSRAAQTQIVSVPTTLLHRRSCGCTTLEELLIETAPIHNGQATWQTQLLHQLVQAVRYPLPPDPIVPPEQLWPGAALLIAAIDAALHGRPPRLADIEVAWQQAISQTENLESLHTAFTLLEDAAERQLAIPENAPARPDIVGLLRRIRLELIRAWPAHELASKQQLGEQVRTNYAVSMALLGSTPEEMQSLSWLEHTPATWGCLGLWERESSAGGATLRIAGGYQRNDQGSVMIDQHIPVTAFPPIDQLPLPAQRGQDLTILCPVRTKMQEWGILALCGWADQPLTTGTEILTIQAALLGATLDRNTVLTTLTEQQATLQGAYDRERMLSQTIRELGCPIIPLQPGVLLVPLIGAIDSLRAQQIISTVLTAISEQQAQTVFLDITGVPIVDTQVASSLIQTAQAATLLGVRLVMVGIRPEIAQSIVGLGIDLRHLTIHATLASALRERVAHR